jgi:hypothetical protein
VPWRGSADAFDDRVVQTMQLDDRLTSWSTVLSFRTHLERIDLLREQLHCEVTEPEVARGRILSRGTRRPTATRRR